MQGNCLCFQNANDMKRLQNGKVMYNPWHVDGLSFGVKKKKRKLECGMRNNVGKETLSEQLEAVS